MNKATLSSRLSAVKAELKKLIDKKATNFGESQEHQVSEAFAACSVYTQFFADYEKDRSIVSSDEFNAQVERATALLNLIEPHLI